MFPLILCLLRIRAFFCPILQPSVIFAIGFKNVNIAFYVYYALHRKSDLFFKVSIPKQL